MRMGLIESLWHLENSLGSFFRYRFSFARKWRPKQALSLRISFFCQFLFFRKSKFEISSTSHLPDIRSISLPSFMAIRPAVWPVACGQTNRQTDKPDGWQCVIRDSFRIKWQKSDRSAQIYPTFDILRAQVHWKFCVASNVENQYLGTKMTMDSHFWQFPEWQPYHLEQKTEFILET